MKKIVKILLIIVFVLGTLILAWNTDLTSASESFPFNGIISADSLVVYTDATYNSDNKITELAFGSKVTVLEAIDNKSGHFYRVRFDGNKEGFLARSYVKNVDASSLVVDSSSGGSYRAYCDSLIAKGFVESYCPQLFYLHSLYPNWEFKPDLVKDTLETASKNEEWKSVLQTGNGNYFLSNSPIEGSYYYIKSNVISSFMDPRNSLFNDLIFQFLDLESSKDIVNDATLAKVVGSGNLNKYFEAFKHAASVNGINPVHLISRSAQEGANKPDYSAVAGIYTTTYGRKSLQGYSLDGYYNYYNIGSYAGSGYSYTVQRGLAYAAGFLESGDCFTTSEDGKTFYDVNKCAPLSYQRPWNTPEAAILGGAEFIAGGYVKRGQNTDYFEKFNVSSYSHYDMYTHQYMTNIYAPISEGLKIYNAYNAGDLLNSNFVFIIPVFKDMSDNGYQPIDKNGDARLAEIKINGQLVTGFDSDVIEYPYNIITAENGINVEAKSLVATTKVSGTGKYEFKNGSVVVKVVGTAENGVSKTYTITVKQIVPQKNDKKIEVKDITDKLLVKINDNIMYGISPGYTAQELINSVVANGANVQLTNSAGEKKTSGNLATGDIITIESSGDKKSFDIAVRGDASGDGAISILDLLKVQKHILGKDSLGTSKFYGGDTNEDGTINILDMLRIQKHILGKGNL